MSVPAGEARRGPQNSLADVAGIRAGHAQRTGDGWRSGVTVVLGPPGGMVCGVDVRGAAPGTRETDLLDPRNLVERVHAIVLTGGSAYGLAAADGVMGRLADAGIGHKIGDAAGEVVPIVPAAVIFDLGRGGSFRATPGSDLGAEAYDAAASGGGQAPVQGSVGAGTGAKVGGFAGGTGMASAVLPDGVTVAALAVVNAAGSPADPVTGELYATRFGLDGEFAAVGPPARAELAAWRRDAAGSGTSGSVGGLSGSPFNTTIGVLATDAALSKAQCGRLAIAGQDGIARAVRPAHTMVDGDTVFGLSCGEGEPAGLGTFQPLLSAAADVFSRAIAHAVLAATGRPGTPSYRDVFPSVLTGSAASG